MSLRAPLNAIRRLTTSARAASAPPSTPPTPTPTPPPSGFASISHILSSTEEFNPLPIAAEEEETVVRGYLRTARPPKADPSLEMLTNMIMRDGKKIAAQNMVRKVLDHVQRTTNLPPQPLVRQAILLASPSVKILSVRKFNKTIFSPRALTERQRTHEGVRWILKAAEKGRTSASRDQRIAREVLGIIEGQSDVFRWLEERHKTGYMNRSNMFAR
ncbi:hypothetical protein IAT38_005740 [Cryptococcus sp. DSM 104549]